MIFLIAFVLVLAVPAGFHLLKRRVERACRMSPAWLEARRREASR